MFVIIVYVCIYLRNKYVSEHQAPTILSIDMSLSRNRHRVLSPTHRCAIKEESKVATRENTPRYSYQFSSQHIYLLIYSRISLMLKCQSVFYHNQTFQCCLTSNKILKYPLRLLIKEASPYKNDSMFERLCSFIISLGRPLLCLTTRRLAQDEIFKLSHIY